MGYHWAGFDVVGVDLVPQYRYPFRFILADADVYDLEGFDAIHASPPCKAHSRLRGRDALNRRLFDPHRDHLTPMLQRLRYIGVPWVVENVPGSPMPSDAVTYCGSGFGLGVRRHRLFVSNLWLDPPPPCDHRRQGRPVDVSGHPGGRSNRDNLTKGSLDEWCAAMGIDWLDARTLAQAIPPAYTEHIGRQVMHAVRLLRGLNESPEAP